MARFWKADNHEFGIGKIHLMDPAEERTLCGLLLGEQCPGRVVDVSEYSCQNCTKVLEKREQQRQEQLRREAGAEERRQQWQAQEAERDRQWEVAQEVRRQEYRAYLESPVWRAKRAKVLARDGGLCQACREQRATQVHHLTYEHIFQEPCFDLVAVCHDCHERISAIDRARREGKAA